MLGDRLGRGNRLTPIIKADPSVNNGTVSGGLAYALQKYLEGSATRTDEQQRQEAQSALLRGLQGGGVEPAEGQMGPLQPRPGGYEGAAAELQGLGVNPYAGQLANDLLMRKAELDIAGQQRMQDRAQDDQRWQQRFDAQNEFTAEQNALNRNARLEETEARQQGQGKFYAVQTGSGTMLVDKGTGMAVMLGVDANGSPVQIGQPFQPQLSATGQALPVPAGVGGLPQQTGAPEPQGVQGAQPGAVRPLMPPSVDAVAQQAVSEAKVIGQDQGERPQRMRAAQSAMTELGAQHELVMQDIDRAITMAQNGGVGPVGVTGVGSMLGVVPGTDAFNTGELLNGIKANLGFDKLQAMRDASPTGGALGQVTERELAFLQATAGSLNQGQSQQQLLENLSRLKQFLGSRAAARSDAFRRDFGEVQPQAQPQGTGIQPQRQPSQGGWSIQRIE